MPQASVASSASPPKRRLILLVVCLGAFMATLDTSIVNIALPQIARQFHSSLVQISWLMVVYLLFNVSLLLSSGRLGDLLPPGRLHLLGVAVFTLASALCGFSPNLSWMLAGRALQGVGASLMLGVAPKIIAVAYGEGERGLALGLFSTAFASGISVGAPLGGLITYYLGWPYIFFINIPICLVVLILGSRSLGVLAAPARWAWRAFDLWGGLTLGGSLGLLVLGLTWVRASGWQDPWTLGALGLGALFFLLLLFLEPRQTAPLLPGTLWGSSAFLLGSLAVVLTFAAVMGTFFLLPFFLEQVYGYLPQQTGLLLAAIAVTNALVAPLGGLLADRLGNLVVLRSGSALILLGLGSFWFTGAQTSTLSLAARFALLGLGFGLFQAPNLNEILKGLQPSMIGLAAATNAVLKNLGALLGITLIVTVFAWINLHQVSLGTGVSLPLTSYHMAFTAALGLGGVNLLCSFLPRKPSTKKPF